MGLFRKKSNSSTNSVRIRRALKTPPSPPPSKQTAAANTGPEDYITAGSSFRVLDQGSGANGYSTPTSLSSNYTGPSDQATSRSTTTLPSSVDEASIRNGRSRQGSFTKVQQPSSLEEQQQRRFSMTSQLTTDNLYDSRPSSMTITRRKPVPTEPSKKPSLNVIAPSPSNSTLSRTNSNSLPPVSYRPPPQERKPPPPGWNPRPPPPPLPPAPAGWNERRSTSPTPSDSASIQAPYRQSRPPLSPSLSRQSTFRTRRMPPLPENALVNHYNGRRPSTMNRRSAIASTPGPKSVIISFSKTQIECSLKHANMRRMDNFHHPVPCMTCRSLTTDGMAYCSWCSLRVCKDCTNRLRRDWNGDITKGWGVVELQEDGNGYMVQWGVQTRPNTAESAMVLNNTNKSGTRGTLDRVSQLLGVIGHKTPEFGFQLRDSTSSSIEETTSNHSTVSPPSPITPPAFNTSPDLALQFKPPSEFHAFSFHDDVNGSSPEVEFVRPRHEHVPQPESLLDISRQTSYTSHQTAYENNAFQQYQQTYRPSTPSTITRINSNKILPSPPVREIAASVKQKKGLRSGIKGMFGKKA